MTAPTKVTHGGHVIAEMLRAHHAGPMFGMGGFQLLPMYDSMAELGLAHHLVNDERAGAWAADAYARVTGTPGLCDATLGPGATNLATALVESLNAGIPIVAFIGDAHRRYAGRNMTQEARQVEILRPAVKDVLRVEVIERIPELVRRAFDVATSGRPGPVIVDVPEDIAHGLVTIDEAHLVASPSYGPVPRMRIRPDRDTVREAVRMVQDAKRPVILAGGGIHLSRAYEPLRALAEALNIPVAHTLSGKGAIACTHPLSIGLFGRYSRIANDLIGTADCLIAIGCKLGEIATRRYDLLPDGTPILQIDIEPEEFGRAAITVPVWGDAAATLAEMVGELRDAAEAQQGDRVIRDDISRRHRSWYEEASTRLNSPARPVHMARLLRELNKVLPPESVLVADGGFAAHWAGLLYDTKRAGRGFVADRGFASIGYGLPAAIGAAVAGSHPVVALTGDGGFNMSIGELETALRLRLGIVVVVVNNAASGYVKALQHAMFSGRYESSDLHELDYAAIARAYGCEGIRVEDPDQLAGALQAGMGRTEVPTVIDVIVTRDPSQMLPGVDSRTRVARTDDRLA